LLIALQSSIKPQGLPHPPPIDSGQFGNRCPLTSVRLPLLRVFHGPPAGDSVQLKFGYEIKKLINAFVILEDQFRKFSELLIR
jgi:hypothetical protein